MLSLFAVVLYLCLFDVLCCCAVVVVRVLHVMLMCLFCVFVFLVVLICLCACCRSGSREFGVCLLYAVDCLRLL